MLTRLPMSTRRVDRRDRPLLGQAPEQRLGRRAIAGRVDPEGPEGAPPGSQAGQLRERRRADAGRGRPPARRERRDQLGRRGAVREPRRVDDAADDGWEPLDDLGRVFESRRGTSMVTSHVGPTSRLPWSPVRRRKLHGRVDLLGREQLDGRVRDGAAGGDGHRARRRGLVVGQVADDEVAVVAEGEVVRIQASADALGQGRDRLRRLVPPSFMTPRSPSARE